MPAPLTQFPSRLWNELDATEQTMLTYLFCLTPPASLDDLVSLAGMPVVKALGIMESLSEKQLVFERPEHGRGFYFSAIADRDACLVRHIPRNRLREIRHQVFEHYDRFLEKGPKKTLVLADLYMKLEDTGPRALRYITDAATLYFKSKERDKALLYDGRVLDCLAAGDADDSTSASLLHPILERILQGAGKLPPQTWQTILSRAGEVAERLGRWNELGRIKLAQAEAWQWAGDHGKWEQYIDEFWTIAQKSKNRHMLRVAALTASDFLFFKGRLAEAIDRYETVVGQIEAFGEDETSLRATATLGWCYMCRGKLSRGTGIIETLRLRADALGLNSLRDFCDLGLSYALIEMGQDKKAQALVAPLLESEEDTGDPRNFLFACFSMAQILVHRGDFKGAAGYRDKVAAQWSENTGTLLMRKPFVLEVLYQLEQHGYPHPTLTLQNEIDRALDHLDICRQGIALRYKGILNIKQRQKKGRAFLDLKNSEELLTTAGADIELARTRIELGRAYLDGGEMKTAVQYLEKACFFLSRIGKNLFPKDLRLVMTPQEQKFELMIDLMVSIAETSGTARERLNFLEKVINVAIDFTMSRRGAFFTLTSGTPEIVVSRNVDPLLLKTEEFDLILDIVSRTARGGGDIVYPGSALPEGLPEKHLSAAGIDTFICTPVQLSGTTYGYLYIDNWLSREAARPDHLPYVRMICLQAAGGLSHIALLDETKRLKDRFEDEATFYRKEMGITGETDGIIGTSEGIRRVLDQIHQVAPTDSSVLITGETGVGKELVAKAIHNRSQRKDGPFIPVNLAALPQELVASELFGHEKGAFTGANERYKGRFELANGGTIFLDEIGDLPPAAQVKLLRVLQENVFERLGSAEPIQSDFRVVAATNKDLARAVKEGSFREDLYYRLRVFPIAIPPLRERQEDIPLLVSAFAEKFGKKMGRSIKRFRPGQMKKLQEYEWPGNVRELEHYVERSVILSKGDVLTFYFPDRRSTPTAEADASALLPMDEMERQHIERVLTATRWRVSGPQGAAAILKMKPTTLFYRMKKLGITKPRPEAPA